MSAPMMSQSGGRVTSLDGMRGIAAILVVIGHSYGAVRSPPGIAGPSVQTFFVLSGYCLAGSALRGDRALDRAQYFIRRIFRIHPPFVFGLIAAWLVSFLPGIADRASGASAWIVPYTQKHLELDELVGYLFFPSGAEGQMPIGWTLEVEMIFSLLLPLFVLIARRGHWSILILGAVGAIMQRNQIHYSQIYALHFCLGIALYEERERLARWANRAPGVMTLVVLVGFAYFTSIGVDRTPAAIDITGRIESLVGRSTWAASMAVGAAFLTVGAVHLRQIRAFFSWRPVAFLGRISYSVYLVHFTILLLCVRQISRPLSGWGVLFFLCTVCVLSIAVSWLTHRWVELPSIEQLSRIGADDASPESDGSG